MNPEERRALLDDPVEMTVNQPAELVLHFLLSLGLYRALAVIEEFAIFHGHDNIVEMVNACAEEPE